MENLNKVVKEIKIVAKPAKRGGKNYFVRVELVNGRSADVWCDKEVVELIQTCTELGVEPFKSFTLERRTSEKTGAEYIAVVLKMFNDDEYFYFLPRATNTIVELLIAKAAQDETATPAKKRPQRKVKLWQTLKFPQGIKALTQKPRTARPFSLWCQSLKA